MALLSGLFSILFFLILIFRQEITEFFVENDQTVVRIGKRKFQVEKYERKFIEITIIVLQLKSILI